MVAKLFFLFKLLGTCEVPAVGIEVDMREALDGSCTASVRYLSPTRDVYYSAIALGDGNFSVGSLTNYTPALGFVEPGEFEDGWILTESGYLEIETDFEQTQILEIDAELCSCR